MIHHALTAPSCVLLAAAVLLGCVEGDDLGDELGADVSDEAGGDKADGASGVVVTQHDLALTSTSRKADVCLAIANADDAYAGGSARTAFLAACKGYRFRVREQARSTLYRTFSSETPLTVWLVVEVTTAGRAWRTRLERAWSADGVLAWHGTVLTPTVDEALIRAIAAEPEAHVASFQYLPFERMPFAVQAATLTWTAARVALMQSTSEDPNSDSAWWGADLSQEANGSLTRGTDVIGYRIEVMLSHANADASVMLHFDATAHLVVATEVWL